MADIDLNCGDCGDCDCDCGDCDCDCECGGICDGCDCDCNCDGCCTGINNVICCCFFPGSSNQNFTTTNNRRTDHSTNPDCSFCCCCFPFNDHTSRKRTTQNSNQGRRKSFFSRLCSCFRKNRSPESSVSSSPNQPHLYMDVEGPKKYGQDGRYPINQDQLNLRPMDYSDDHRQAKHEKLNMPPHGDYGLDGRWSRPTFYGGNDRHWKTEVSPYVSKKV